MMNEINIKKRYSENIDFTITAEIHARSLANFYCQNAGRHMKLKSCYASASQSRQFENLFS